MIHDIVLRSVVIGLFGLTAAEYGVAVVTRPRPWASAVNHALHFVMGVAMVMMAWSAKLPTTGPAVVFMLAALTFVGMAIFAVRTTTRRELYAYHGLMMLATAWMFASMGMSSMNMPATNESPVWLTAVGWVGGVGFAGAAGFWTYRYVLDWCRKTAPRRSLGDLGQAMMAAGMAIFFFADLFQL